MKQKINYRNAEECLHATYNDMKAMTLDDAVFILSEIVRKYHEAKNDRERTNLPRVRIIKAYEIMLNIVNQPDMREKVKEYISELDKEIERCEELYEEVSVDYSDPTRSLAIQCRIETLSQVKSDLKSRLEELI
ncbi:MAG: hypothetical protein MSG78_04195 [Clostridiales bacterium]|nr:hypothetical protein [Clostridiales bacterium]